MINSMKRQLPGWLLLVGVTIGLSACGGEDTEPGTSSSGTVSSSSSSSSSSGGNVFVPPEEEAAEPVLVMALNAGGAATRLDGIQYQADAYFTGGQTYSRSAVAITGASDATVYLTERYGDAAYAIPVSNGKYTVVLNFAETYHTGAGLRVFNVSVEGQSRLTNVDIFKTVGANTAMSERIADVNITDGQLNIGFQGVTENPKVSGIVIYQQSNVLTHASKGQQIFEAQCQSCHAATDKALGTKPDESGHNLQSLIAATGTMPPAGLEDIFGACDDECGYYTAKYIASVNPFFERPKPGPEPEMAMKSIDAAPPLMDRLSKNEYNNTIRDLFGITSNPANDFPQDQSGTFSNDNAALTVSNIHVEMFDKAAQKIAIEVVNAAANGNRAAISCDITNANCAQTVITQLGLKVWRRPLTTEESANLKSLYDEVQAAANDRRVSMTALVRAMLLSPNFIFRPEFDQDVNSRQAQPLNAYELASRLSYFLWSSTPDDQLLAKAANGSLTSDATLRAEVTRMLADSRSDTLLDNFAWAWLGYADYGKHEVDKNQFPQYTDAIAEAFLGETRTFLRHILKENRPISEILNADYTFLNQPLANFYGVQGIFGNQMQLYKWPQGSKRIGLLGHGSSLTAHSHPNKTSPVKRGTWVMDKLMCDRPPEPPGDVIAQFPDLPEGLNPRAESELHKESSGICASCHAYVDPIGYGMENFSPIGQWRDEYPNGDYVDSSSVLPTGESFSSLVELAEILAAKHEVTLCSISYAMTYATGRRFNTLYEQGQPSDYAAVYEVYQKTKDSAHSITDVFTEIVMNPAFRMRRGADSQ